MEVASAANAGHRRWASPSRRSVLTTGPPVWKQSWHGPLSLCTASASSSRTDCSEAATNWSRPVGSPRTIPAALAALIVAAFSATSSRNSMMSKSATRVSATATKTSVSLSRAITSGQLLSAGARAGAWSADGVEASSVLPGIVRGMVPLQMEYAVDDVPGHGSDVLAGGEGVSAQACHRLGGLHPQVDHDHPLRLVDLHPVGQDVVEPLRSPAVGGPSLLLEQQPEGDLGEAVARRQGFGGERTGLTAVDVEHPHPRRADLQGEGEHRADPELGRARAVDRPSVRPGSHEVGLEHRPARGMGVQTGTLAQRELQLLETAATRTRRGGDPGRPVSLTDQADA